jgi:hypothetical protein
MVRQDILENDVYTKIIYEVGQNAPDDDKEKEHYINGVCATIFAIYSSDIAKPLCSCISEYVNDGEIVVYKL